MANLPANTVLAALRSAGFDLITGVPCSYLTPLIDAVIGEANVRYVPAANEGDAIAIAAGAELGGDPSVVMFQNSGLGNTVNPLTSLTHTFGLPVLIITTWRGEPGGSPDEPQHDLMGPITPRLLEHMQVPWERFPSDHDELRQVLQRARAHMQREQRPYALLLSKGTIAAIPGQLPRTPERTVDGHVHGQFVPGTRIPADDALRALHAAAGPRDVIITTTGFCGRALYAIGDRDNQLYMVGSMGCASSLGLGLALTQPDRRIFVADGDGAALMRLGALTTIGHERPANLVHVLLDNAVHDSTGAQATVSPVIDLALCAAACGYPGVHRTNELPQLQALLQASGQQLTFVHVRTEPRQPGKLPRPQHKPPEVVARLRRFLAS